MVSQDSMSPCALARSVQAPDSAVTTGGGSSVPLYLELGQAHTEECYVSVAALRYAETAYYEYYLETEDGVMLPVPVVMENLSDSGRTPNTDALVDGKIPGSDSDNVSSLTLSWRHAPVDVLSGVPIGNGTPSYVRFAYDATLVIVHGTSEGSGYVPALYVKVTERSVSSDGYSPPTRPTYTTPLVPGLVPSGTLYDTNQCPAASVTDTIHSRFSVRWVSASASLSSSSLPVLAYGILGIAGILGIISASASQRMRGSIAVDGKYIGDAILAAGKVGSVGVWGYLLYTCWVYQKAAQGTSVVSAVAPSPSVLRLMSYMGGILALLSTCLELRRQVQTSAVMVDWDEDVTQDVSVDEYGGASAPSRHKSIARDAVADSDTSEPSEDKGSNSDQDDSEDDTERERDSKDKKGRDGRGSEPSGWRHIYVSDQLRQAMGSRSVSPLLLLCASLPILAYRLDDAVRGPAGIIVTLLSIYPSVYLGVRLVQRIFAFLAPPPHLRLLDALALANISLVMLDSPCSGYYLHGGAPAGHGDGPLPYLAGALTAEKQGAGRRRGFRGFGQSFRLHIRGSKELVQSVQTLATPVRVPGQPLFGAPPRTPKQQSKDILSSVHARRDMRKAIENSVLAPVPGVVGRLRDSAPAHVLAMGGRRGKVVLIPDSSDMAPTGGSGGEPFSLKSLLPIPLWFVQVLPSSWLNPFTDSLLCLSIYHLIDSMGDYFKSGILRGRAGAGSIARVTLVPQEFLC
ncbi:Meckelin [Kipferlia bialata]|uniref:Meckelin n=1 Tax=Kipferlia bialata TaxID=797122 RepID=A0A9K3CTW7_9EUKA|nr:Meckelin [Kipferlia bialata]|eukprot:g2481.t1